MEAATGRADWSAAPPSPDARLMVDDAAYLEYDPEDARAHVVAVTDGEPGAESDVPEAAGDAALLPEFGAEREEAGEETPVEEHDLLPTTPTGPGVDAGPLDGLADRGPTGAAPRSAPFGHHRWPGPRRRTVRRSVSWSGDRPER